MENKRRSQTLHTKLSRMLLGVGTLCLFLNQSSYQFMVSETEVSITGEVGIHSFSTISSACLVSSEKEEIMFSNMLSTFLVKSNDLFKRLFGERGSQIR